MGVLSVVAALIPPAGVAVLFYVAVRSMIRADSAEREADRQFGTAAPTPRPDNRDGMQHDDH